MKAVVQRVSRAKVTVDGEVTGEIGAGLLVLVGVSRFDQPRDVSYLVDRIVHLRIFEDDAGQMNRSLLDIDGGLLIASQFTLYGDTRKGRRPSFIDAAPPERAEELYDLFTAEARSKMNDVQTGRFRAMMNVELVNNGPVTLILESPND
ncbi:MAG: D-aminoacyl-tRNA deacylase [Pyrinomonadaceae bacterium]